MIIDHFLLCVKSLSKRQKILVGVLAGTLVVAGIVVAIVMSIGGQDEIKQKCKFSTICQFNYEDVYATGALSKLLFP